MDRNRRELEQAAAGKRDQRAMARIGPHRLSRLSALPDEPDVEAAQALAIELQEQFLSCAE